jgi:hypothetical protein
MDLEKLLSRVEKHNQVLKGSRELHHMDFQFQNTMHHVK